MTNLKGRCSYFKNIVTFLLIMEMQPTDRKLINKVKKTVNEKTGINLELEVKIIE